MNKLNMWMSGWCGGLALVDLVQGKYEWAALMTALAICNYMLSKD